MMVMAKGYQKVIANSNNQTLQLQKLASGALGDELLPPVFNVNYVGPEGPMTYDSNGDLTTGYVNMCTINKCSCCSKIETIWSIICNMEIKSLLVKAQGVSSI